MNILLVAERNNFGVAALEAGDLRSALDHFSVALKYTMGDLDNSEPTLKRKHDESSGAATQQAATFSEFCAAAVEREKRRRADECEGETPTNATSDQQTPVAGTSSTDVDAAGQPTSLPFAYARGINLIPCLGAYSPDSLINTTIISSIIIFNLSIIYHLKGLEGSNQSLLRLSKAKSLYQKSHRLLTDAGVPLAATGNPVIDMLSMALFNNLAHVSFEMQEYSESRKYFDHLIRFALTVVPARYVDTYVGSLLDQQKSNFLLNAIILQPPRLAAAA